MQKLKISSSSSAPISVAFLVISFLIFVKMADSSSSPSSVPPAGETAAVHIVYTEKSPDAQPEAYHIQTLTSVLGSEEAAKEALVYSYKTAASGFSARLTPTQVDQLSKQPGVLQVVPSQVYKLHSAPPRRMQ